MLFTGINVEMERWGTVIGVAFGLFYPLSGDFFAPIQTAVFRNTEGDSLPNEIKRIFCKPKVHLQSLVNITPLLNCQHLARNGFPRSDILHSFYISREVACPYILHVQRKLKDITSTKRD